MIDARPSPNFDARPPDASIDMLVLHYTGMASGAAALERLTDPAAKVSAHYLVEEDGRSFRLVPDAERAWHAGASSWAGRERLNDVSIGIEIVNPGHDHGLKPFPDPQIEAVATLSRSLIAEHAIPQDRVVAHSDIAPTRKRDPGDLFPWRRLAEAGVGLWPDGAGDAAADAAKALATFGYDVACLPAAAAAFQRRFRPAQVDGVMDAECMRLLGRLAAPSESLQTAP